jgi:hypothetical protein
MTTLEKINSLKNENLEEMIEGNFKSIEAYEEYKNQEVRSLNAQ